MREPTVAELMTRQVITIVPDTPFREVVGTMLTHDVHALPVIDLAGRPIGVVTSVDTLAKLEYHGGADYPPLLTGTRRRARWRKASGVNAAHLMTTPAPIIGMRASLTHALRAMAGDEARLYVVDDSGQLVGKLARHDLLRLLLRSDGAILADIERSALVPASETRRVTIRVDAGVVTLSGTLRLHSTTEGVCRAAHRVPGVITVHNELRYDIDDFLITGI